MQYDGGGGGGGGNQYAEDLADLFELELDKLANQYEMQQRAMQQSGDNQIDQLVEKLKELARRQQQEMERQRRLAQAGQSGGNSGANQRALADELEKAAQQLAQRKDAMDAKVADLQQQLEKLANETRRDEKDASRRLDEAAGSIRDKKIREMIRYSKATLQGSGSQYARGMEETIGTNLD